MRIIAISVSVRSLILVDTSVHAVEDGSKPSGTATVTFNITGMD